MLSNLRHEISSRGASSFSRALSTPALPPTEKELAANSDKIASFRKTNKLSVNPLSLSAVMPPDRLIAEVQNPKDLAALAMTPPNVSRRMVNIAPRRRKTNQAGGRVMNQWVITYVPLEQWSNPLMGWTSSADPMSTVMLFFDTEQSAVEYCERNDLNYKVNAPNDDRTEEIGKFKYADNFLPPKTMEIVNAEGGSKSPQFKNWKYGASHWFMPDKYHGDGPVIQHG